MLEGPSQNVGCVFNQFEYMNEHFINQRIHTTLEGIQEKIFFEPKKR